MSYFGIPILVCLQRMLAMAGAAATLGFALFGAVSAQADEPAPKDIYAESCAVCHGIAGEGAMPGMPDLTAPNGNLSKPETDLIRAIVNGIERPGLETPMPPSGLDEKAAKAVLDYLRDLAAEAR